MPFHQIFIFYNTALINFGLNWTELPNKKFPIIFDSINGLCQQQQQDMSLFNQEEIDRVLYYIEQLLTFGIDGKTVAQDNIGVVTPYKKQVFEIGTYGILVIQ